MPFTAMENNEGNGCKGKITILRLSGDVQEALGNVDLKLSFTNASMEVCILKNHLLSASKVSCPILGPGLR